MGSPIVGGSKARPGTNLMQRILSVIRMYSDRKNYGKIKLLLPNFLRSSTTYILLLVMIYLTQKMGINEESKVYSLLLVTMPFSY